MHHQPSIGWFRPSVPPKAESLPRHPVSFVPRQPFDLSGLLLDYVLQVSDRFRLVLNQLEYRRDLLVPLVGLFRQLLGNRLKLLDLIL